MGLLLATASVGCGDSPLVEEEDKKPRGQDEDEDGKDEAEDADDDEDESAPPSGRKDAGASGGKDAGTPQEGASDAGGGSKPGASANALWCSAKAVSDKYCTSCHDGEGTGGSPMGLVSHADYKADALLTKDKKVYEVTGTRIHDTARPMPPKAKLTADELKALDAWIEAGAPGGDDASCSEGSVGGDKPTTPVEGDWKDSDCDAVYELRAHGPGGPKDPYMVPPGAEIHPQIYLDAPWGDEKVQVIGFRPLTDNKKVIHHWILYNGLAFLAGWAPGDEARPPYPKDVGMDMPSGKRSLRLDMHYYNLQGTKAEPDNSGVAVCVLKKDHFRPKLAAVHMGFMSIGTGGVLAPRGAVNKPVTSTCTVTAREPVHVLTAGPHAHQYATHMKFTVKKKDGREIVMHDQPFVFGEQGTYALPGGEVILETGDQVTTVCSYTNMTGKDIRFGESTESEMCFNFATYYPKGALSCGGFGGGLLSGAR